MRGWPRIERLFRPMRRVLMRNVRAGRRNWLTPRPPSPTPRHGKNWPNTPAPIWTTSHALREDLIQQRDRLQALCDRQLGELEILQVDKAARLAATEKERERTASHLRAVEDRAHQEIDRARQEIKQWQHRHEAAERSYRSAAKVLEARCETLQKQWQHAEREVARLSGHVVALETSLASARPKVRRDSRSARSSKPAKTK